MDNFIYYPLTDGLIQFFLLDLVFSSLRRRRCRVGKSIFFASSGGNCVGLCYFFSPQKRRLRVLLCRQVDHSGTCGTQTEEEGRADVRTHSYDKEDIYPSVYRTRNNF